MMTMKNIDIANIEAARRGCEDAHSTAPKGRHPDPHG